MTRSRRHLATVFLTAIAGALLMIGTAACQSGDSNGTAEAQQPDVEPARVNLPNPPPDKAFDIKTKNADGTLRVGGIIASQAKFLDQEVEVKAVITRMTEPCDPRKAERRGETCPKPHMEIRDSKDARKKMLVVGYEDDFIERADLETGETHTFAGTYKEVARGFVASGNGLIDLKRVDEEPVTEEE